MHDTSVDVLLEWNRRFQESTLKERLERSFTLMNAARAFAEATVRKRFPNLQGIEFKRELVRYLYGDKCAEMIK